MSETNLDLSQDIQNIPADESQEQLDEKEIQAYIEEMKENPH